VAGLDRPDRGRPAILVAAAAARRKAAASQRATAAVAVEILLGGLTRGHHPANII